MAEREGFEPPDPRGSTVFKTAAFDHSATSPRASEDSGSRAERNARGPRSAPVTRDGPGPIGQVFTEWFCDQLVNLPILQLAPSADDIKIHSNAFLICGVRDPI